MKSRRASILLATLMCAAALAVPQAALAEEAGGDAPGGDAPGGASTASGYASISEPAGQGSAQGAPGTGDAAAGSSAEAPEVGQAAEQALGLAQAEGPQPAPGGEADEGSAPAAGGEQGDSSAPGQTDAGECAETSGEGAGESVAAPAMAPMEAPAGLAAMGNVASAADSATASAVPAVEAKAASAAPQAVTTAATSKAAPAKAPAKHAAEIAGLVNGHVYILVSGNASNRVLGAGGGNAFQQAIDRSPAQQWKVVFISGGYVTLQNMSSGKLLDVSGGRAYAGANAIEWKSNGGANQKWSVRKNADSTYTLITALTSKMALDIAGASKAPGANAILWNFKGSANQKWSFVDATEVWANLDKKAQASKGQLAKGDYVAVAGNARGKTLDVTGASNSAGANMEIWVHNNGGNQKFRVAYDSKGYATITCVKSGKVLDVSGAKAVPGANVIQWGANGGRNQKWIITKNADGTYAIASALWDNLVLDITGNSSANGANVEIWSPNGGKNQKWDMRTLHPAVGASQAVANGWYSLKSGLNQGYFLDVTGCNANNGTALELWTGNGTPAQALRLFKVGDYYRVESGVGSGVYLGVEGGMVVPGTKAEVRRSSTNATLFSLQKNKDGSYRFVNVASGLALAVTGGKATQGVRITAEKPAANSPAQGFFLVSRPGLVNEGIYTIRTAMAGARAITVKDNSYSNGAQVVLSSYRQAIDQKWQVKAVPGRANTYTVESLSSGYRLAGATNAAVTQRTAASSPAQWWTPSWLRGAYVLTNVATGKVLDAEGGKANEGTRVLNWTRNGKDNQRYTMTGVAAIESGIYEFLSYANAGEALDITGRSTENGANVELYARNGGTNQRFRYDASTGVLTCIASGKAVDVEGASTASGANAIQWAANGGANQKWTIGCDGGGKFKISSRMGHSLVLTSSSAADGANVTSSTDKGSSLQRWRPVRITVVQPTGFNLINSIVSNGHGSLNASYIVIHETANPGATAKNHRDYWRGDDTYAVHYTMDWTGNCYYCVPEDRLCWQVGKGNKYVVGIELCHATNKSDFNKVYNYGVQWARWQLAKNGWGVDRLISHYDCTQRWGGSDHTDPIGYFQQYGKSWAQFKEDVRKALAAG